MIFAPRAEHPVLAGQGGAGSRVAWLGWLLSFRAPTASQPFTAIQALIRRRSRCG